MAEQSEPRGRKGHSGGRGTVSSRAGGDEAAAADFVEKVVSDPAAPPAVWLLAGYPGRSAREGQMRLYLSPDLSAWIDVPEEAVVHTEEIPTQLAWPPCIVAWVRQDAHLTPGYRGMTVR
jgi:hypothetical protein